MKKLLLVSVLFSVIAVAAFAQLNVGAYTQSFWIPYRLTVPEEGDPIQTTAVQAAWGEPDISAGINLDGWSEWGGLHLGVEIAHGAKNQAANPFSAKGNGWVWVKPLDFVPYMETFTIYAGSPYSEKLMGKIGGSNLATYVLNKSWKMHDGALGYRIELQDPQYNIFTRINPYAWGNADNGKQNLYWPRVGAAAMVTVEPIENLFLGVFFAPEQFDLKAGSAAWEDAHGMMWPGTDSAVGEQVLGDDDINQDYYDVKRVYRRLQIQAGYDFPGIGLARLQYIGMRNVMEAAFQLRALGDLVFDIGFKLPFEDTNKDNEGTVNYKKRRDLQASVAATYRNYDFRLLARVDTAFAGSDSTGRETIVRGLNLIAYIIPSYQFNVGTVGLDFGFEYEAKDDLNLFVEDSMQSGLGLWFARSMGNANFKFAAVTRLPLEWNGVKQPFDLFFPIYLQVGF